MPNANIDLTAAVSAATQMLRDLGLLGGVVFALYANFKRLWVWGSQLDEIQRDRDEWKAMALRLGGITDRMINGSSKP